MQVSEVRVKLVPSNADRLKAFCSVTFDDCFVIRDLKVIEGANGLFVAMPSRKLTDHCPFCKSKDIEGGHVEIDYKSAWQEISCNVCHKEWTDIYTLTDIEEKKS